MLRNNSLPGTITAIEPIKGTVESQVGLPLELKGDGNDIVSLNLTLDGTHGAFDIIGKSAFAERLVYHVKIRNMNVTVERE